MEATHEHLHLDKWNLEDYGHCLPTGFILIVIFFDEAFEYGYGVKY
jgi:hypothetical protein